MSRVLLCSTSAPTLGGRPTGLWLAEMAEPYYLFQAAGFTVTIGSPAGGAIPIDAGSMGGDFFTADAYALLLLDLNQARPVQQNYCLLPCASSFGPFDSR